MPRVDGVFSCRKGCLLEISTWKEDSGEDALAGVGGAPGIELVLMTDGAKLGDFNVGWFESSLN